MTWLRNPKVLSAIVFLLLIALVWFVGPYIGLPSREARFFWIFLLMLMWVVILMTGKIIRDRSANVLERMLRRNVDHAVVAATPEQRAEVALLRQRLLAAIDTLKTSNLGKSRGKAALYELPWYMLVGHPSAGKSCAILNSGLKFPLSGKGSVAIQGIGGTRNCDWFFATEGVLLDTAGRYSTQPEDRLEWLEFLQLLRKHRSKAPLNGILVAASLPELLHASSESFASYARAIRQRINEVDDLFGMKVPVYLLFTKLDLLQGFHQFFEDLSEEERSQVWGATLTHEQQEDFDAPALVRHRFEELFQGLAQHGMEKLAGNRANLTRPALFSFPLEFHGLQDAVCRFVEHLVEKDPYHTKPMIRGFYFTSALQEGGKRFSFGDRVSSQFGLVGGELATVQADGSKPYFLDSLFRKVVFPDLFLVGRSVNPRRNRRRLLALAGAMALLALLSGCWTWSLIGNQKLIGEAQQELASARTLYNSSELGDKLKAMQVLQLHIEQLYHYRQEGHPWKLGWGLYRGDDVEQALKTQYYAFLRQMMLQPVQARMEKRLADSLGEGGLSETSAATEPAQLEKIVTRSKGRTSVLYRQAKPQQPATGPAEVPRESKKVEDVYNLLKAYLMLQDRGHMEAAHLTDQITHAWRPWLEENSGQYPAQDIFRMAERAVAFYVSQIKEPDIPVIQNRQDLVSAVRTRLRGEVELLSPVDRIYSEIKAQGNTKFAPVTVARILENKNMDLLGTSVAVPGFLTREAWNTYVRETLEKAAKGEFKGTDWVLDSSLQASLSKAGTPEEIHAKLEALYKADYISDWQKFLQGIAVQGFGDFDRAIPALGKLGDPQTSPIKAVLVRVAHETAWDNPSELSKTITGMKDRFTQSTENLLGVTPGGGNRANPQLGTVGGTFAPLAVLVAGEPGKAPLDGYLELILKLKGKLAALSVSADPESSARQLLQATLTGSGSEFAEAQQMIESTTLNRMDDAMKEAVRPLLLRPLLAAHALIIPLAEQDINRAWSQQVYAQWTNLADKYPFADSANDASMADIAKFLKPGEGTLARFVDKYLAGLVLRHGSTYSARSWGGQGVRLGSQFLGGVSKLMDAGSQVSLEGEAARFELQPTPTSGIAETLIEIDGQRLLYRNGPQQWMAFTWPGQSGAQGARIQVTSNSGATMQIQNLNGRLGWMRLLDAGSIENANASAVLNWRFKPGSGFIPAGAGKSIGRDEFYPQPIRFNFRMVGGINPLLLGKLRHHTLPSKIGY